LDRLQSSQIQSAALLNLLHLCLLKCPEGEHIDLLLFSLPLLLVLGVKLFRSPLFFFAGLLHFSSNEPSETTSRLINSVSSLLASFNGSEEFSRELHILERRAHTIDGSPDPLQRVFEFFPTAVLDQTDPNFWTHFAPHLSSAGCIIQCCEWAVSFTRKGEHCPLIIGTLFQHWLAVQPVKTVAENFLQVTSFFDFFWSPISALFVLTSLFDAEFHHDLPGQV